MGNKAAQTDSAKGRGLFQGKKTKSESDGTVPLDQHKEQKKQTKKNLHQNNREKKMMPVASSLINKFLNYLN